MAVLAVVPSPAVTAASLYVIEDHLAALIETAELVTPEQEQEFRAEFQTALIAAVEAWARSAGNPVGGWYGLKKGLRGRFANYVPPVLEQLGLAEVEHNARNNRMRAMEAR